MGSKKYLIVVGGATASGKTALAIDLARHFQTEVLSADSRQFYVEMDIGNAKPTQAELAAAHHHFINSLHIRQAYSAGDFERDALVVLEKIFEEKDVAVLVGGSGLFIRAVCEGMDKFPQVPGHFRQELDAIFQTQGIEPLQKELLEKDPGYYHQVDLQNPQRLMRALSVCRACGQPFSGFLNSEKNTRPFTPIYILLKTSRKELYEKINRRVDHMMESGLLEEARALFPDRHLNALQTVGYQELFEHFEGKTSLAEAVEKIKQNSRRYAKRQETWFRKDLHWQPFSPGDSDGVIRFVDQKITSFRTNPPSS